MGKTTKPGADEPLRQHAALAFRQEDGMIRVVLITSRGTGRWVLPKGHAEKHLSGPELAAKEAFEEAGVIGRVGKTPLGSYHYAKLLAPGVARDSLVQVFPLAVSVILESWPEQEQRERRWFTLAQAAMLVDEPALMAMLLRLAAAGFEGVAAGGVADRHGGRR